MILLEVPKLTLSTEIIIPIAISWSSMIVSALLVWLFARWLYFTHEVTGALMLVTVLTNSTFVGIPIINAYLGSKSLPFIIVYDQIGTFLALSTYGTFIVAFYAHRTKVNFSMILIKVVSFPPFISLVVAMMISGHAFSSDITSFLEMLSSLIVPLALFAVGLQLQFRLPRHELQAFSLSLVIKLIIAPIIAIITAYTFGWEGLATQVSIMEAGMPPMITAAAMASMVGLAPRLCSAIVGYGILFSFATTALLFIAIA